MTRQSSNPSTFTEIFLGRQPILDAHENLYAFELLFRASQVNGAQIADEAAATATVITNTFGELGADAVLGQYPGFINLSAGMIYSDVIEVLPKDRVVLELLETVEIDDRLIERLRELRGMGYRLALDDYIGDEALYTKVLELVEVVKVDVMGVAPDQLAAVTRRLEKWPVKLLAEKVNAKDQVERCLALGYELFQGYYFAKPSIISGRSLSPTQTALMRLMGLLMSDAETTEIETVFKQNPDLSVKLLRIVNTVGVSANRHVASIVEAISLLGRSQLQRWLQLLMFSISASKDSRFPSPLLVLAATRGKLLELLVGARAGSTRAQGDAAFLAGILSLLDALLGMPLPEILQNLSVSAAILLGVLERSGELGQLLTLAEFVEKTDIAAIEAQLAKLPHLNAASVNEAYAGAIKWANSIADKSN